MFPSPQYLTYLVLAPLDQLRLRKVWVKLNLIDRRFDLSGIPYLVDLGDREVGDADGLDLSLLHEGLHRFPCLNNWNINDIYAIRLLFDGEAFGVINAAK